MVRLHRPHPSRPPLMRERNDDLYSNPETWATDAGDWQGQRDQYCTDFSGNVIALVEVGGAGGIVEQYRYSSSGVPYGIPAGDLNGDGVVDAANVDIDIWKDAETAYNLNSTYDVRADLDLDGDIDSDDGAIITAADGNATGRGVLSVASVRTIHGYGQCEVFGTGLHTLWGCGAGGGMVVDAGLSVTINAAGSGGSGSIDISIGNFKQGNCLTTCTAGGCFTSCFLVGAIRTDDPNNSTHPVPAPPQRRIDHRCGSALKQRCSDTNPWVSWLLQELGENCGTPVSISCCSGKGTPCESPAQCGRTTSGSRTIDICICDHNCPDESQQCSVLAHELLHAWQFCNYNRLPTLPEEILTDPHSRLRYEYLCREIAAYYNTPGPCYGTAKADFCTCMCWGMFPGDKIGREICATRCNEIYERCRTFAPTNPPSQDPCSGVTCSTRAPR